MFPSNYCAHPDEDTIQCNGVSKFWVLNVFIRGLYHLPLPFTFTNTTNENLIDHNEKDGGMYILPEFIASIKTQCLDKDDTKSPDDEKFHHNEEINLLPYACLQKTSIPFCKRFPTAKYSGKMYIRHLFRHGQ